MYLLCVDGSFSQICSWSLYTIFIYAIDWTSTNLYFCACHATWTFILYKIRALHLFINTWHMSLIMKWMINIRNCICLLWVLFMVHFIIKIISSKLTRMLCTCSCLKYFYIFFNSLLQGILLQLCFTMTWFKCW